MRDQPVPSTSSTQSAAQWPTEPLGGCTATAVIAAGFLTVFIAYAIRYGYGLLLPHMLTSLAITKAQAGIIYSTYFLSYTLASPVMGLLSDRYDMRWMLTAFTALLGVGAMLMALSDSVLSASIYFMLSGIGHSACWAPVMALVQKWVPDNRRGIALALTTLGAGIGITIWSLVLPPITAAFGWRAGWICMGIFGLGVAVFNYALVRDRPACERCLGGAPPAWVTEYRSLFRATALWQIGFSYLMVGYAVMVPTAFLVVYATQALGISYGLSARLIAIMALSGIAGKLLLGYSSDRLGRVPMMMLCGLLMGLGNLGFLFGATAMMMNLAAVLFGLGFGAVWPVYAAAAPDHFERRSIGAVIGIWTFFMGVGSMLSPVICGYLIDITGSYSGAFGSGAVAALLGAVLLSPPPKHRSRSALRRFLSWLS
jgi:MFS family permease